MFIKKIITVIITVALAIPYMPVNAYEFSLKQVKDGELEKLFHKIKAEDKFLSSDIDKVMGGFKYAPVFPAKGIAINGDLSDWESYPPIYLPTLSTQYQMYILDSNKDLTAWYKYAYDEENFYLAIEVTDDVFSSQDDEDYWRGDSVQLALSKYGEVYGSEIGFVHNAQTGGSGVYSRNHARDELDTIDLKTTQKGNKTIYEAAIPWKLKYGEKPENILFDCLINDNDGNGRAYCVELAPGISEGKNNGKFPYLEMVKEEKKWYAWMEGNRTAEVEKGVSYDYYCDFYLVNYGEDKEFTVSLPQMNISETVSVAANSGIRKQYKFHVKDIGQQKFNVSINDGDNNYTTVYNVNIGYTTESYDKAYAEVEAYRDELKELLEQCKTKNIISDYESLNYMVIDRFIGYFKDDVNAGQYERAEYVLNSLRNLYKEAKNNLQAYLDGRKEPKAVPHYVSSKMEIEGKTVSAEMKLNGVVQRRPAFFLGYGHFGQSRTDIPVFSDFGANAIQNEIGPKSILVKSDDKNVDFKVNTEGVQWVLDMLKNAEENNIAVSLLLSPHYFPPFIIEKYPDAGNIKGGYVSYNVNHPKAKEAIELYLKTIIPLIKDYKSLNNICLSNEPGFASSGYEFYKPLWKDYISSKYSGDISKLNETYSTSYDGFEEVNMPSKAESTPLYYDYIQFNNKMFAGWHEFMADTIKEIAPEIPVHVKIMNYIGDVYKWDQLTYINGGVDHELFSQFSDLNGNDGLQFLDMYDSSPLEKSEWYDFQTGVSPMPVANTEDHVIRDRDNVYIPNQAKHIFADMWQGGIHARAISTIWEWERSNESNSDFNGSILHRPDCVAAVGKANYDLNRLAYEVKAIIDRKPDVAILYSAATRIYTPEHSNTMYLAYENTLFNGQKVDFVTEKQINKIFSSKLLIVPSATNVSSEVLDAVKNYLDKGGKVLLINENSLGFDEYNNPHNAEIVDYIRSKSTIVSTKAAQTKLVNPSYDELRNLILSAICDAGITDIALIDVESGERVNRTEWESTVYNGSFIVNMCNYEFDKPKKVRIEVGGRKTSDIFELRSDEKLADEFVLEPFEPILVSFKMENNFFDTYNHWAENDIIQLSRQGVVKGISECSFEPEANITCADFLELIALTTGLNGMQVELVDNRYVTREEMATIIVKAYELKTGVVLDEDDINFSDREDINEKHLSYVKKAAFAGFLQGCDNKLFPNINATRAEAVAILKRMLEYKGGLT